MKKIPKPTIMELNGKRPGASAAPMTQTPGSFPPSCRDPFRWARADRSIQQGTAGSSAAVCQRVQRRRQVEVMGICL